MSTLVFLDAIALPNTDSYPARGECGKSDTSAMWSRQREERLRRILDEHLDLVARVLRNAGVSEAQLDDEVQRTWMTVARRLEDVRPGAERSFLVQIALRVAAHARRTVARRREISADDTTSDCGSLFEQDLGSQVTRSPEYLTDQKRTREKLDAILDALDDDLREVFVLYEFEEMSMIEIAGVLGIPQGTVASRLRRARAIFRARVSGLGIVPPSAEKKLVGS